MSNIVDEVNKFREERDWNQFHNPKDLAISVSLEASELVENFQWKSSEEALLEKQQNIKEELADVLIYSLMLASDLGLDYQEIIREKLCLNRQKYPVTKSKGIKKKYTEL